MKQLLIFLALSFFSLAASAQQQCKGTKKDGTQCKIKTVNADGYCRYHDPKSPHCTFIKKDGKRCKMIVNEQQLYCRYHAGGKVHKVN